MSDNPSPDSGGAAHWRRAAGNWHYSGSPLRPHPADSKLYQAALDRWSRDQGRAPDALLLGVTPELFHLRWPKGTDLLAVDRSREMVRAVWPGSADQVLLANWVPMPLAGRSRDLVLCDGGLMLLEYPHQQEALAAELRRVIRTGGYCILRLFAPPTHRESVEQVIGGLRRGEIPDLNVLKYRLWLALHHDPVAGIRPHRVWELIHQAADGDLEGLAKRLGWPVPHMLALEGHRNSSARYCLSGVEEVEKIFCGADAGFSLQSVGYPDYPLGDACPTVVLART